MPDGRACAEARAGRRRHEELVVLTLARSSRGFAAAIAIFALFQIYLGALVAGLDAGFSYNTWPLMDGAVIPN